MSVTITPDALSKSAAKFRKELLQLPIMGLGSALNYFTVRTGIRGEETVGELGGTMQIGPYDEDRVDSAAVTVKGRTLHNYKGSVVKRFSPNSVAQSIYGDHLRKGTDLGNADIVRQVLSYLSGQVGKSLASHLFDATRNTSGTGTVDLFNGFDTITASEITDGNISVAKNNLHEFTEAITESNAYDKITSFCEAASDELLGYEAVGNEQGGALNLYVPKSILYAYRKDFATIRGTSPIYNEYNQTVVEGFPNITLVPTAGKGSAKFIQLSTRNNMLIGVDQESDLEDVRIGQFHEFKLSFIMAMFFGVDFESVAPERLFVGKLYEAPKDQQNNPPK